MSKPSQRQLKQVRKIQVLSHDDLETLRIVLLALGFDTASLSIFWEGNDEKIQALFARTVQQYQHIWFDGNDLANLAELIHFFPGIVQRKLNFNESQRGVRKVGFKSRPAQLPWEGPPSISLCGDVTIGRKFVEIAGLVDQQLQVELETEYTAMANMFGQIRQGKHPVRYPELRAVVRACERLHIEHSHLPPLRDVLKCFPVKVRTPSDVLEALTTTGEPSLETTDENMSLQPVPTRRRKNMSARTKAFIVELQSRQLGPVIFALAKKSRDIYRVLKERLNEDQLRSLQRPDGWLHPGEFGVLIKSPAFERDGDMVAGSKQSLLDFWNWWDSHGADRTAIQQQTIKKLRSDGQGPTIGSIMGEDPLPKDPALPANPIAPRSSTRRQPLPSATKSGPDRVETDSFGVVWNFTERTVTIDGQTITFLKYGDEIGLSQRVYNTLNTVREHCGLRWPRVCEAVRLDRAFVSSLVSDSELNPSQLQKVVEGVGQLLGTPVTVQQILGLADLPESPISTVAHDQEPESVMPDLPPLFTTGDRKTGRYVVWSIEPYRIVKRYFQTKYGWDDQVREKIAAGQMSITVPMLREVIAQVKHITDKPGDFRPRAFNSLVKLEAALPPEHKE